MNKIHDCIIVGAGPAGGTAAYHLAKNGRDVLILEKEKLPRYKPCGGGVSPEIGNWFDFDFSPVISVKIKSFQYTWRMKDPIEIELEKPIWMVMREQFDYFLIKKSLEQGANLQENTKVTGVSFTKNSWLITTNNGDYQSRYIIAADGSKGQTAKLIGFKDRKRLLGGAIEAETKTFTDHKSIANFEFGMIKNGYLWNFPKADGCSFGIGIFRGTAHEDIKAILASYASILKIDMSTANQYGHPLYIWDGNQNLHSENEKALLTGESACLVDPLTAEGIRPSIYSGLKASEAINQAISGDTNAIKNYTETIKKELGKDMKWAEILAWLLYSHPQFCYRNFLKNPSISKTMGKIFCGEMHYRDLPGKLLSHFGKILIGIKP